MRRARARPQVRLLRSRLERLRERAVRVSVHARLGRELRLMLTEQGSAVWKPAEDLSYRSWIERNGDEEARMLLQAVDEMVAERWAEIEAREREEGAGDASPR